MNLHTQLAAWAKNIRSCGRLGQGRNRRIFCAMDFLTVSNLWDAPMAYFEFWHSPVILDNDYFVGTPEELCLFMAERIEAVAAHEPKGV